MELNPYVKRCVVMAREFNHIAVDAKIKGNECAFKDAVSQRNCWLDDARSHFENVREKCTFERMKRSA